MSEGIWTLTDAEFEAERSRAMAAALRAAADDLAKLQYIRPGAAGRGEYERLLAVRRGNTDAWLRSRAAIIDANADPEGPALVQAIHDRKNSITKEGPAAWHGEEPETPQLTTPPRSPSLNTTPSMTDSSTRSTASSTAALPSQQRT